MQSRGLGDSIAKFTEKTGIKTVVEKVSDGLNIPCGCKNRQEWFNEKFPYKNNMAFKLKSPFNLDLLSTSMFERDMEGDPVHARTPKNGVIILNEDSFAMDKDPKEKLKTIVHELEHVRQYKSGELDYGYNGAGKEVVWWKGKEYDYSKMASGDPNQPWEKKPYQLENKINKN